MSLELDDLPFIQPSEDEMTWVTPRKPAKCKHPKHLRRFLESGGVACTGCGADLDPVRLRRGKTARNRGNSYEREVAAKLGGRRVGQYGDSVDVDVPGYLRVQCKNGAAYPKNIDRWLRAIPVEAGILRAVVLGDAPGPGGRRRSLICFDLDEFAMWHGEGK